MWEYTLGNSSPEQDNAAQAADSQSADPGHSQLPQEFVATEIDLDSGNATDGWSEATDGQCSESAALFAASQPAPLSIV